MPKKSNKYLIFSLLFTAWVISFFDRASINLAIIPISEEIHLSPVALGLITSSFYVGYALMQFPGGWLADKFGSRIIIISTMTAWSFFTGLTGLAWSFVALIVIRFLFGLGEGGYPSSSVKAIAEAFPKVERPKAASDMYASNYVGSAIAPLIAAPLLVWLGWRHFFIVIGAIGVLFVILMWIYFKPNETKNDSEMLLEAQVHKVPFKTLLKTPILWNLAIMYFGIGIVNKGLDAWMPVYLVKVRHLSLIKAGFLTTLPFIAATIAAILAGWLCEKYFKGRVKYIISISTIITAGCLYGMYTSATVSSVIAFQIVVYFFKGLAFCSGQVLILKSFSKEVMGSSSGIINLFGQSAGFVAPAVMGLLISMFNGSYDAAFGFLIAANCLAIIAVVTISEKKKYIETESQVIL